MARRGKETSIELRAIIVALYKADFSPTAISPIVSRPNKPSLLLSTAITLPGL